MSTVMDTDYVGLVCGVRSLWEGNNLFDYTIQVEDQEFKVHKVVLAATSNYFNAMLTGRMAESQTDRVRIDGVTPHAIANMIHFIYTGNFCKETPGVEELLAAAMYLQIPRAISKCKERVSYDLNPENAFTLLSMLQAYSVSEETVEYIVSHFDEVYRAWKPYKMTLTDINNLVDLWQKSEWELFLAVEKWIEADRENRQKHVNDLMNRVRFALLTVEQLKIIIGRDVYSAYQGSWCQNVINAMNYHTLPTHSKVLDDSEQKRVRGEPSLFYFNSRYRFYYKLKPDTSFTLGDEYEEFKPRKCWEMCKAVNQPEMLRGIEAGVVVNNFLIVWDSDQKWHVLDPRTMEWSTMTTPSSSRWNSALVSCNKGLYVLGGCVQETSGSVVPTDVIERYDFETDSWNIFPSKLPHPMSGHGAIVIDDCIYIIWGSMSKGNRLDCFDTSTGTWHSKATPPRSASESFTSLQVMEYGNEKVLFFMYYRLEIQYYRPSQDAWYTLDCGSKCWSTRLRWHPGATVLSDQKNKLFLLNFKQRRGIGYEKDDAFTEKKRRRNRVTEECVQWTFSSNGELRITEKCLEDGPGNKEDYYSKFTRLLMLAVPPQTTCPPGGCENSDCKSCNPPQLW